MRPRRALTLLAGLLLLAGLPAPPARPALAQASSVVDSLQFEGRVNVREEACREVLSLKPGAPFSPARMETDRRALLAMGFFRSVGAFQQTADGRTRVTFRLVEWPRVLHLRVLGNTVVDRRSIHEVISTQPGQVLCAPQLQDDVRSIERLYRERGYVVRVSERLLDEAARSGVLRFELLEVRIAEVRLEGASAALRDRCRAALAETAPALYRPEAVGLDQRRLLDVRGVKSAVPRVEPVSPGQVRIRWLLNPPPEPPAGTNQGPGG